MTLYNCVDCRRWHSGTGHVCTDPLPEIRDQNSLKNAVVKAAREVNVWARDRDLEQALLELDGLDRPLEGK